MSQLTTQNNGSEHSSLVLQLYITGATHHSMNAVQNIKKICEEHLKGDYELDIVDVYQQPSLAKEKQIIAAPTLIKLQPLPFRRIVGDMSDTEKILSVLDITKAAG